MSTKAGSRAGAGTLLCACLLAGSGVDAQMVVGRVLERGGGGAVPGAMVRLTVSGAPVGQGWLTGVDGRFRLQAAAAGAYALSVERIGFATTVVDDVALVENGIVSMDVVVETRPIALDGLRVEAEGGRCERGGTGGAAQLVWDEARKALSAARWTESQGALRFVASVWDRQIDPRTSQILVEQLDERETVGANSVQSLPPAELVADGYVRIDPAYSYYYAPDAEVLLSDEFQDTHCFRVVESEEDGSPYLGLGFEPDDDRRLPDVRGVIWLDAETGRLDRVEFDYTGLRVAGAQLAEGEVRWAQLANGQWIVRDWHIRAPMGGTVVGLPGRMRRQGRTTVHEVGSSVQLVQGSDFVWRPDVAPAVVRGGVFDSISGGPLPGAEVRIAGRSIRAVTDLDGRFELGAVPPGLHRVTFGHADLDSIGVTPGWSTVEVGPGEVARVELVVPSWITLLSRSCPAGDGVPFVGVVRTRNGSRVGGATVELVEGARTDSAAVVDVTDAHGAFRLCGVPAGVARVVARRGGAVSEASEVRVPESGSVQADLVLRPPAAARPVPGALRPALIGTVVAQGGGGPLVDVAVELLDADGVSLGRALTDGDGVFRIVLDEGAEVFLSVSRLGFTGAVTEAIDVTDGTRRIEVTLPEEAIELEPVVVVVEGRDPRLEVEGFYQRALSAPGMFIRRDDVEAVAPGRTSDLLGRAPGVRVRTDPLSGDLRRRVTFQRLALASGDDRCYPAVFIDGNMVRVGGSRSESDAPMIEGIEPVVEAGSDIPSLDELVPPHEIRAVELYQIPGQVPRRFVGLGTHCGVVVIWTTRGDPG